MLLEAYNVAKAYGATPALIDAEFAIDAGEIVAVMGPSGSGKSTLLHCIAGIVPPDSGTVHYDGRELSAMSDAERSALRRSAFGFVFQFGQLVPELSCRENVALPLRLDGVSRRVAEARADELLRSLEVDDVAAQRPGTVSGGEGQRVAVARALVTDPRVLWQSAVPVALGIGIAVATGVALGAVLLRVLGSAVRISWFDVAALAGVGVAVVLAVTAASLPVLWRTMRPEGLRTE